MENLALVNKIFDAKSYFYTNSTWAVTCSYKRFKLNNKGIKLIAKENEALTQIIFDVNNKTVSVVVSNPILVENAPRTVSLNDDIQFFDDLRSNLEDILLTGGYSSVTPNEDRTVFEIS